MIKGTNFFLTLFILIKRQNRLYLPLLCPRAYSNMDKNKLHPLAFDLGRFLSFCRPRQGDICRLVVARSRIEYRDHLAGAVDDNNLGSVGEAVMME